LDAMINKIESIQRYATRSRNQRLLNIASIERRELQLIRYQFTRF